MAKNAESTKATPAGSANLEQVRDILFGKSFQELEKRFNEMQDSLSSEITKLKEETKEMFDGLENYVRNEISSLDEQLKSEVNERDQNIIKINTEATNLAQKVSNFEKNSNKIHGELRNQIHDISKKFSDDLSKSRKEILEQMNKSANELHYQKADRSKIATLLTEMAIQLSDKEEN